METKSVTPFWWVKNNKSPNINGNSTPQKLGEEEISNSLAEFLRNENEYNDYEDIKSPDVDIDSILEEISRLSAKSPLGPYESNLGERSIEEIMKEAEKIYNESSKSFEQLSQRSKTSQNLTNVLDSEKSDNSTPTPKSLSPLPLDDDKKLDKTDSDTSSVSYSEDFSDKSELQSPTIMKVDETTPVAEEARYSYDFETSSIKEVISNVRENVTSSSPENRTKEKVVSVLVHKEMSIVENNNNEALNNYKEQVSLKDDFIKSLKSDNDGLKGEIKHLELQLHEMRQLLEETNTALKAQTLKSPVINLELDKVLEELKDSHEINTALQVQLDSANKSHQLLKTSYDDLLTANKQLERRMIDVDLTLEKYKQELKNALQLKEKLESNSSQLNKIIEIEKIQVKNLKAQIDKDSRCIMDLNRQIKEMERIIARKHPDSVSALIVAAKNEASESSPTARKILEDRIKALEKEALMRDAQNSQVFIDVQEKFNQMKLKYESHIEDLELHVSDLKMQLKRKLDTYDVYTQTINRKEQKIPAKDTSNASVQTAPISVKPNKNGKKLDREGKEETHLIATIRGLQADLANKEKVVVKLQKEVDELRKTNRRLQKEREGSLKNLSKDFRSYPDKLSSHACSEQHLNDNLEEELQAIKIERDKTKQQLCRIEEDYQALKSKRLQDLNTLQEAHEREVATYLANITPLREQLDVQQVSLSTLQQQLVATKEELAVVTVERDHLNNKVKYGVMSVLPDSINGNCEDNEVNTLRKKICQLELKYEERENRLRAIVHGLAQKSVTNRSCEQCAARQQQLIGYKAELDQLIATLRCLQ